MANIENLSLLGLVLSFLVCIVMAATGLVAVNGHREVRSVMVVAIMIRLAVAGAGALVELSHIDADAFAFHMGAMYKAQLSTWELFQTLGTGKRFFEFFLAITYIATDSSSLPVVVGFAWVGAYAVFLTYLLSLELGASKKNAVIAAWVMAIDPSQVLFSSMLMREPLQIALIVTWAYCLARWLRRGAPLMYLLAGVAGGLATCLHNGLVTLVLVQLLTVFYVYRGRRARIEEKMRVAFVWFAFVLVGAGFLSRGVGLEKFSDILGDGSDAELVAANIGKRNASIDAEKRATYLSGLSINSPLDLAWQAPVRVLFFIFTPFPWMMSGMKDVVGVGLAITQVVLWFLIITNYGIWWRSVLMRTIVLFLAITVLFFALGTTNYGTAIRHRTKITGLEIALVAAIVTRRRAVRFNGSIARIRSGSHNRALAVVRHARRAESPLLYPGRYISK